MGLLAGCCLQLGCVALKGKEVDVRMCGGWGVLADRLAGRLLSVVWLCAAGCKWLVGICCLLLAAGRLLVAGCFAGAVWW